MSISRHPTPSTMSSSCCGNHPCHLDEHGTGSKSGRRRSSHCSQGDPISNLGGGSARLYAQETCPEVRKQDWTERRGCAAATATASGVPLKEPWEVRATGSGLCLLSSVCAVPGKGFETGISSITKKVGLAVHCPPTTLPVWGRRALAAPEGDGVGVRGDELTWMS